MAEPRPTDEPVVESSDLDWEIFWERNKSKILLGAIALIIVLAGTGIWFVSTSAANRAAEEMLAKATDAAGWQAVIEKYPRSAPAADAYFRLAAAQRAEGKLDESSATFRKFLDVFPKHELAGGALFGIGQNLDAAGKLDEAANTYRDVLSRYPSSYAAPFAAYSESEIYLRDFRRTDARRVLESLRTQYPQSPLAQLAGAQLQRLDQLTSQE